VALAIAAAALLPTGTSAAVTCTFAGGALDVDVSTGSSQVSMRAQSVGDDIEVFDGSFGGTMITPCGGVPANQPETGTTSSINIDDGAGLNTIFQFDLANGPFEPGAGAPEVTGTSEIEITINAGDGTDSLGINATGGPDTYRFGALGANQVGTNLNADDDGDDIVVNDGERLRFITLGLGDDVGDASGGSEFTGPVPYDNPSSARVAMTGGDDDDTLTAGSGSSFLEGDAGDNTITGGAGADELGGGTGTGTDLIDGGGGIDSASYQFATGGVHVDLRIAGPQDTVTSGTDTLSNLESIVGSQDPSAGDLLIGTNGPNGVFANAGDDTLVGLGGDDALDGRAGNDTASYEQGSTTGITLSLETAGAQSTGGAGTDTLVDGADLGSDPDVENIVGSPFADNLTGNDLPNEVIGGAGGDTISLLGGDDRFDVLDGVLDTATCGDGSNDSGVSDENGVDVFPGGVPPDCETIDFAPQTSVTGGPLNGVKISDRTPTYTLSADESPVTFERRVDGGPFVVCQATCPLPSMSDGAHTLAFRATDSDLGHNTTDQTPAARIVTIDATPPRTTITGGPTGPTNDATPTFRFSSSEAASSFQCRVDGGSFASCASPRTTAALSDGQHTFQVRARDQALNFDASPASRSFAVDTDPPETEITKGPKKKTRKKKVEFEFGADEAGSALECSLDGAAFSPCQSPMTVKAKKKGKHSFEARSTDEAGNTDPTPDQHTWKRKKKRQR